MLDENLQLVASKWLEREDTQCRQGRLGRLEWMASRMPMSGYLTYPGGWMAKSLLEEARYCFAYGQFMAATVLGLAYVERTLAAWFFATGRNDLERASLSRLLSEAATIGWITEEQHTWLDDIRRVRNPIVHFRAPLRHDTIEYRSVAQDELPYELMERDAEHVMEAALHVLARNAA